MNKDQLPKINYFPGLWLKFKQGKKKAKNRYLYSITENPDYLPAIFSLCVMGMLEDDETLTAAALQELAKVSVHIACKFHSHFQDFFFVSKYKL